MRKFAIAAKFLVVIIALAIIISCSIYKYGVGKVSDSTDVTEVIVNKGDTWYTVADTLKKDNLIKSASCYRIYIKLSAPGPLQAGKYSLSPNMGVEKIVEELKKGSNYNALDGTVTFKEGLNMRAIAKLISSNTNNSYDSVFDLLKDESYIDELITKYWFITEDIKNSKIYYPLEGYLFPDTYSINKEASVKDIFKMMLDKMDIELTKYKSDIEKSNLSIHIILTLSSIVELEASNSNDRASVAGVFYNRLSKGITLGSDVTAYYAYKMDDWTNGLTVSQINECNSYNTRSSCLTGLPVGPICNPGNNSIQAVLEPKMTDNLFFVADCSGKTYLTKTNEAHEAKIEELKKNNNWCDQ